MMNRRSFLKSAIAVSPLLVSPNVLGVNTPGANETINVGIVGLGGRSRDITATCLGIPGMRIAAVCDCFGPRVDAARKALAERDISCAGYLDLREMLDKENLDGVMAITTTHARAWVSCMAMAAGKDVYIEKPMCLTIAEGREMVKAARKHKRVTQVGTQQRTIALNNWACDLVKNGAIGKVTQVLAPNFMSPLIWEPKPGEEMPDGGRDDWWDVWTNQSELRPYHPDLHRGWAQWADYDGGGLSFGVTGWGAHSYDQVQRGLGTDLTTPTEIVLEEAVEHRRVGAFEEREISEDETGAPYYGMVRNAAGPRAKVRMRYENGTELLLHLDGDYGPGLGCIFVGEKGKIEVNRDRISAEPRELLEGPDRPEPLAVPETQPHIENWLECIKTRETCTADIEYGQNSSTICYLVNIVRNVGRVGDTLRWDPAAERFTNCDEGNTMLARARREGYELP